jgi:predicted RND superfamily exporter protein
MVRRYYETLYENPNQMEAAASSLRTMFAPAMLAILCDAIGLYMVYLAPVPLLKNLAIVHGNWSMMLILNIELLTPALLAVLPVPRDLSVFMTREHPTLSTRIIRPAQIFFEKLVQPQNQYRTLAVMTVIGVTAFFVSINRPVGNVAVGSPLLFPNNPFNVAEREINRKLAGTTFMNVIWEGKVNQALRTSAVNSSMRRFQENVDLNKAAAANVSLADLESPANALINGGNPKWLPIDHTNRAVSGTINVMTSGKSVRNLSRVADYTLTDGDVILWFKDLRHSTVDKAMADVRKALGGDADTEHNEYRVKLAAGPVALQYAIDNAVRIADIKILVYLLAVIGLISWITYGSATAALMLLVPLVLSQFITGMVMYLKGIGLDLNTLPVNAIGLGVGIDYGIYLLSRICDEYQQANDGDVVAASIRAIDTTGEGTLFVAATITLGVLPWYFIAKLKFLSDLGFMLALTMTFNAVMAMIVVPLEVVLVKPKFLARVQLMKHA